MAEKLPRYRPLGVGIPSIPTVDYAATGAMSARGLQSMSAALDRISQFAFKEAGEQAKLAGEEYGASNAPTREQLDEMVAGGEQIQPVGGTFTIFDRAARKASLDAISNDLGVLAKEKIQAITLNAENKVISVSQMQQEIEGVVDGISSSLSQQSPAEARSLRAALALYGNNAITAQAKKAIKEQNDRAIVMAITNAQLNLEAINNHEDSFDTNGNVVRLESKVAAAINNGMKAILSAPGVTTEQVLSYRNRAFDAVKSMGVSEALRLNAGEMSPSDKINLSLGIIPKGSKLERIYNMLDAPRQADLQKEIRSAISGQQSALSAEERDVADRIRRGGEARLASIYGGTYQNPSTLLTTNYIFRVDKTRSVSRIGVDLLRYEANPETSPSGGANEFDYVKSLEDRIYERNPMAQEMIARARLSGDISREKAAALLQLNETVISEAIDQKKETIDRERSRVREMIGANYDKSFLSGPTGESQEIAARVGSATDEFNKRVFKNGEPASKVADDIVSRYMKEVKFGPPPPSLTIGGVSYVPKSKDAIKRVGELIKQKQSSNAMSAYDVRAATMLLLRWERYNASQEGK